MSQLLRLLVAAACALSGPVVAADVAKASADPTAVLLQKVQSAARQLDYSGVFTYQQGGVMLSSGVVHVVDGTGERERLEILDGAPREYLRHNDVIQCLVPEKKLIIMQSRRGDRFPGLLIGDGQHVSSSYVMKEGSAAGRVAGRSCKMIELVPKDSLRYGYRLCIDSDSDLLLKAQTLGSHQQVVDQIAFTSIRVGEKVAPEHLHSSFDTKGWQVLEPTLEAIDLAKKGWRIPSLAGFQTITQVTRSMSSSKRVNQLVLSDGLAAISVFIEPFDSSHEQELAKGAIHKGAMNIYGTRLGDHWLTAIGEVPAQTLSELAERTEYVPLSTPN